MNIKTVRIIALVAIVVVFATSAITMALSPKKNLKISEYNLGLSYDSAMAEKKPFVLIFYSDYCSYCVQSMPKYLAIADAYKGKYNIVMVNTDNPSDAVVNIARDYAISSLPTLYIVDPSIDNRIFINGAIYGDLASIRVELDRYLRIRAMIR